MMNNMSTLVSQEPTLPSNNEEVIHMLGLDSYEESNTSKLLEDVVRNLDINSFTITPCGEPVAAIGFESIQGHQQIGNPLDAYQTCETISYVDLSPVTPYGGENSPYNSSYGAGNSPYHVSEAGSLFSNTTTSPPYSPELVIDTCTPPASPQGVSYIAPVSPAAVDNREGGGKAPRRRRDPKPKLYQRDEPLSDPEEEKKRLNAINAKKNRDKQKNRLQELEILVKSLTDERDALQASNIKLKKKSDTFESQLRTVCQQFNVPVIILPQD